MLDRIVRLEKACKTFPLPEGNRITALGGIDLEVGKNEFLTLLGPSGCGKTTLLHAISGFVELDSGGIWVDEEDVTDLPPHRRPVNTVFQNYALFPHMTVGENTGYALDIAGVPKAERLKRVGAALEMVGLAGLENRRPRQLSGGQQQRVALARAVIGRPKLLLLDEPLSALDRGLRQAMQIELKSLQAELGISFIFVTHDQEEALTMSDRVAVLQSGVIQQIDTPRNVYDRPANTFVASFIGASNLFSGRLDISGDRATIAVEGEAPIRCRPIAAGGPNATALIRPEQFFVPVGDAQGGDREGGAADLPAIHIDLEQIVFVGAAFELHGRTKAGRKIVAMMPAAQQAAIAEIERSRQARLAYDPDSVHVIAERAASS